MGDPSYTEQILIDEVVDGVSSLGGGEQAALMTIRRIKAYARQALLVYLPSHDPNAATVSRLARFSPMPVHCRGWRVSGERSLKVRATTVTAADYRARTLDVPPGFGWASRLEPRPLRVERTEYPTTFGFEFI